MKFLTPLTVLFLLVVVQETSFLAMADMEFIDVTCQGTPDYNLCRSILFTDRNSPDADLTGLARIVVDALKNKGVNTLQQIKALKKSKPEFTPALTQCGEVYNIVVSVDVPLTINALNSGNAKFAEGRMTDSSFHSEACERSFGEHGYISPMTDLNKSMKDVASIARAIIRMLL